MGMITAEEMILDQIKNKKLKQRDIADTYRLIMLQGGKVDWSKINRAIMERWSRSGLERVKNMAWKEFSQKWFEKINGGAKCYLITYKQQTETTQGADGNCEC